MKTVFLIIIGLAPAAALRYLILRKPISRAAAAGTCFGILVFVGIMVSSAVEKKSQKQKDEEAFAGGPVAILSDLASGLVKVGVPVVVASYFILRAPARDESGS
jgi:1,4-dihydroxy-2-naphthoate octaprenyltransferase